MSEEYDIYRQCYCGCVFAANDQGIDLQAIKQEAQAFMENKDGFKEFEHVIFKHNGQTIS